MKTIHFFCMQHRYLRALIQGMQFNTTADVKHLTEAHQLEGFHNTRIFIHHFGLLPQDIVQSIRRLNDSNEITMVLYSNNT